jgi:hypothetical protein
MNLLISLVFLTAGVILLIYGFMANDAIASHVSRTFTGHPTDRTTWFLIGGALCAVVGVVGLVRLRRD